MRNGGKTALVNLLILVKDLERQQKIRGRVHPLDGVVMVEESCHNGLKTCESL